MKIQINNRLSAGILLVLFSALILLIAWPAAAGPREDSLAYFPLVSSPQVPVDQYETDFTDSIEPWMAVRWQNGTNYSVKHVSGCDGGRCGFLDVQVKTPSTYAIVSPLIHGPVGPYTILIRAKLKSPEDKDQYGVVFGGDWDGAFCPGVNVDSCFNHYYEVRMRYRDTGGEQFMEYRIRRVDSHDSNNVPLGEDLVDWTRASGVNAGDWNKWEVLYTSGAHIRVKANNLDQPAYARDSKYMNDPYFGVFTRTLDAGDADALFDKYSIIKN